MIGIKKVSSGRMGNRLFHYHILRQLARKLEQDYFLPELRESQYFTEMQGRDRSFKLWRSDFYVGREELLAKPADEIVDLLRNKLHHNQDIVLVPPLLGEVFFDYLFYPPSDFLEVRAEYALNFPPVTGDKTVIGLHFRGTDFKSWNPAASLPFAYYQKAIELCAREWSPGSLMCMLYTDDSAFPPFLDTVEFLKTAGIEWVVSQNLENPIADFYQLSQCDVIISSPSTFAILAGSIGKPKKIIHSQSWLDYAVGQQDRFWVQLLSTKNPYYSLWRAV